MSIHRCNARLCRGLALIACALALLESQARSQSIPVTFTVNPTLSNLSGTGSVRGDFPPVDGIIGTIGLLSQPGGGGVANWSGTITAQVGFHPTTHALTRILITGATLTPQDHGLFSPGTWDPETSTFGTDKLPAQYGVTLPGFVQAAVRNSTFSASGLNTPLSTSNFKGNFGLQFTTGRLDLNPGPLGDQSQMDLTQLRAYEVDGSGNIVWRHKIEDIVVNSHTVPNYGNIVPEFSTADGDEPARLWDPTTGLFLPQVFQNVDASVGGNSTITATAAGGGYNLNLSLATNATAKFFIGAFEVSFAFSGNLVGSASVTLPTLGDATGDGKVTGADYTRWADNFGKFDVKQNALWTDGDWNGDGKVTGADYTIWADHFAPGGAFLMPAIAPVPEPSAMALGLCGALGFVTIVLRWSRAR
jgi:hypothetical protein